MKYTLLPVTILAALFYSAFQKLYARDCVKRREDSLLYCILTCTAALAALLVFGGRLSAPSLYTVVFGAVFGLTTALGMVCGLLAMQSGPMSLTSLVSSCSTLIPTFSGALFWNEKITPLQIAGVAMLLVAFGVGINPKKDKSLSFKWFGFCMGSFAANGGLGVMQKIQQTSDYPDEASAFLDISFITIIVILLVSFAFVRRSGSELFRPTAKQAGIVIAGGLLLGSVHKMNLYLAGAMPSIIFFPVNNGSVLLLSAFVSRIFFKEKLSKRQLAAFFIGFAALIAVSLGV